MTPGSRLWNALYADTRPREQTAAECDFIAEFMPAGTHPAVLDMACEMGRHSLELAARGYTITGLDLDTKALQVARERALELNLQAEFIAADLRELGSLDRQFDGIILFWQSFGFFDQLAQTRIFTDIRRMLRPGGRLILDLYNRLHFSQRTPQSPLPDSGESVPSWEAQADPVTPLSYEDDLQFEHQRPVDMFDPHLFTPGEIAGIAANHDLALIASCSNFRHDTPATPEHPRMQLVFERRGS